LIISIEEEDKPMTASSVSAKKSTLSFNHATIFASVAVVARR